MVSSSALMKMNFISVLIYPVFSEVVHENEFKFSIYYSLLLLVHENEVNQII